MRTIIIKEMTFVHPEEQTMSQSQLVSCYKAVCSLYKRESMPKAQAFANKLRAAWYEYLNMHFQIPEKILKNTEREAFK